jgi:hypothetical protein
MNRYAWLLLAAIVAAGATGYWLGQNRVGELMPSPGPADTPAPQSILMAQQGILSALSDVERIVPQASNVRAPRSQVRSCPPRRNSI